MRLTGAGDARNELGGVTRPACLQGAVGLWPAAGTMEGTPSSCFRKPLVSTQEVCKDRRLLQWLKGSD